MRAFYIFLFFTLSIPSFSQLQPGFNKEEVRDMIALCNSFTFIDLYNSDKDILPAGYDKKYTSGVFGMDNKYQIYQKGTIAIINLRGSTAKKMSWLENIHSAMIPAKGTMKVAGEDFTYCFARDTTAAVHSGYALGIAFLSKDILYHIDVLNREGIYDFIITGHSQGGALANLLRTYLENLQAEKVRKNNYKTYAFAAPKIGNKAFSEEYNDRYCVNNSSFNIVNPADPIPTFPLSYNESLSENFKSLLFDNESFSFKKMVTNSVALLLEDNLSNYIKKLSVSASRQISKEVGPVEMPDFVQDINYQNLNNRMEIKPVLYPKILRDSTILENDSLMTIYKRGEDGHFLDEELYQKESWTYQHKPYNYYVSVLEMYFPEEYYLLDRKYLMENL